MKQIIIRLDVMLALRKVKARDLAARIGITEANLSLLRTGKVKGVRFDTLALLCEALDCTPGDLLEIGENVEKDLPPALDPDAT
jgi:putative transcriptional regulator